LEKKGLQGWDAATNNTDIGFDGRPDPEIETFPGDIEGIVQHLMNPVRPERPGNNDDTSDPEKNHQSDSL